MAFYYEFRLSVDRASGYLFIVPVLFLRLFWNLLTGVSLDRFDELVPGATGGLSLDNL